MISMHIRCNRKGFTLIELLVALGVGMVVIQMAFASFFVVQKYVNRIQRLGAASQTLQAAITWHGYKNFTTFPVELQLVAVDDYAPGDVSSLTDAGEKKVRRMPYRIIVANSGGKLVLYDLSNEAKAAKANGDKYGITGWLYSGDPVIGDPRVLAEITLP